MHALTTDTQPGNNFAQSSGSGAGLDGFATAFQLMAITEKTADPATNDIIMTDAFPEHELEPLLLKLPPEIRCLIYGHVFMGIVEDAEAFASVRRSGGRAYQSDFVRANVNALPHTCRIIRKECAPIYEKLSRTAVHSRINDLEDLVLLDTDPSFPGIPCCRAHELEEFIDEEIDAQLAQGFGPPWDESQVDSALCSMRALGDIDNVVMRIDYNVGRQLWRRKWYSIKFKVWDICLGVQNRLHDGTGVRKAFEAESRAQAGVEVTGPDVELLLRVYATLFLNLVTPRMPPRVTRPTRFGQRVQQAGWSSRVATQTTAGGKTSRKRDSRERRLCKQAVEVQNIVA